MYNIEKIIEELKNKDKFRFKHSIGVMETALELSELYDADVERMKVAAFLHDYAKTYSNNELRNLVKEFNLDLEPMIVEIKDLCHGPVGAELIKREFGIDDEIILNAIRFHTFADRSMSKFDMILYLADLIEPNRRKFKGYQKIKKLVYKDLEEGMIAALNKSIEYIIKKNEQIYLESIILRNRLLDKQ
jgi:predicted HD superfamily hydrolase involved in NAD metabolism